MNLPGSFRIRNIVKGHKVNSDSLPIGHELLIQTDKLRIFPPELTIAPAIPFRITTILKIILLRIQLRFAGLSEFLVFFPQKAYIRIVIPGNIPMMSDCAQHGTAYHIVMNITLFTDTLHFLNQLQLCQLYFPQFLLRRLIASSVYADIHIFSHISGCFLLLLCLTRRHSKITKIIY